MHIFSYFLGVVLGPLGVNEGLGSVSGRSLATSSLALPGPLVRSPLKTAAAHEEAVTSSQVGLRTDRLHGPGLGHTVGGQTVAPQKPY